MTVPAGQSSVEWRVIEGDCREAMLNLPAQSVDAIVTDPPYGLGFMGKAWDDPRASVDAQRRMEADIRASEYVMRRRAEVDAVNAGMSRQGGRQRASADYQKRQAKDMRAFQEWCEEWATEALRVLRPSGLAVVFGGTRTYHRLVSGMEDAGFEVRDQLDWLYGSGFPKHASALKPGHEPICMARKAGPRSEPLNIDACRLEGTKPYREVVNQQTNDWNGDGPWKSSGVGSGESDEGRWPANVILDEEAAAMLDEQSGTLTSPSSYERSTDASGGILGKPKPPGTPMVGYGDVGGASRFFYCAKPDSAERNVGLLDRNPHPTVKPVELMRWLIRLVTPEGGTVLDPFTGSGTTGIAALREQRSFIGIEREAEYVEVARARIIGDAPLLNVGAEAA